MNRIAVPTALANPVAVIIKLFGDPQIAAAWERLDKIPSVLMLIMAISGTCQFLLPYIFKAQRKKEKALETHHRIQGLRHKSQTSVAHYQIIAPKP